MKRIKKYLLVTIAILCGIVIGACSVNTIKAEQTNPIKIWLQNKNGKLSTYCVVDEDTGVNYIAISGEIINEGIGTAIIPRYNADGSLYVSK